jgi:hypothetical protein
LDIIDEAAQVDHAGSTVLEFLLRRKDNTFQSVHVIGLKETILVACWYLWWLRRQRTSCSSNFHGQNVNTWDYDKCIES